MEEIEKAVKNEVLISFIKRYSQLNTVTSWNLVGNITSYNDNDDMVDEINTKLSEYSYSRKFSIDSRKNFYNYWFDREIESLKR